MARERKEDGQRTKEGESRWEDGIDSGTAGKNNPKRRRWEIAECAQFNGLAEFESSLFLPLIVCSGSYFVIWCNSTGASLSPAVLPITTQHQCMNSATGTMSCALSSTRGHCRNDMASRDGGRVGVLLLCLYTSVCGRGRVGRRVRGQRVVSCCVGERDEKRLRASSAAMKKGGEMWGRTDNAFCLSTIRPLRVPPQLFLVSISHFSIQRILACLSILLPPSLSSNSRPQNSTSES
ncbi:hypothetical protein BLNAU_7506 [Blattamonas nauphoetae]|uniref:Uncharacterized protein n=1 Tax=Blattamonas nauphoetae TaxID=2049346 RepID=A0ABQ9Y1I9_9EUKA|nr:hypothetical protein BLNAU_7506 [Blattamonas nauphoetae]